MMPPRLPSRPSFARPSQIGAARPAGLSSLPQWHRPLSLVYRRPAGGVPRARINSGNGAPVSLSLHFSWKVWLSERLTTVVRKATTPSIVPVTSSPGSTGCETTSSTGAAASGFRSVLRVQPLQVLRPVSDRQHSGRTQISHERSPQALSRQGRDFGTPVLRPSPASSARGPDGVRTLNHPTHYRNHAPRVWAPTGVVSIGLTPSAVIPDTGARPGGRFSEGSRSRTATVARTESDWTVLFRAPRRPPLRMPEDLGDARTGATLEYGPPTSARRTGVAGPALDPGAGKWTESPAGLVHRQTVRPAAATLAPRDDVRPSSARTAPSPMDLDRLGDELWRRFEKRARVENERRGRG